MRKGNEKRLMTLAKKKIAMQRRGVNYKKAIQCKNKFVGYKLRGKSLKIGGKDWIPFLKKKRR